jgi:exosortase J
MSANPQVSIETLIEVPAAPSVSLRRAIFYSAVAVLGAGAILPSASTLWNLWTQDALKSIGFFVPVVSLVLILRAWRSMGWEARPNWWGLGIVLATALLGWIQLHSVLLLVISTRWTTVLPPSSLPLVLYGAGAVLLLGGMQLFRAALFPIGLLWFANPVPHAFSLKVDLPLQSVSAHIARSFAMHLGHSLTPDHLRLMFTPEFGMFIAPGCNGIRGSITMALIALVAGHVYRFRWYMHAAVVTGAILLGYLFNLVRLCLLVFYYIVALHLPWLQSRAEMGDYIIGAALFLLAAFLLFSAIHQLRDNCEIPGPTPVAAVRSERTSYAPAATIALVGCLGFILFLPLMRDRQALLRSASERFPQKVGSYMLVRTWEETYDTGAVAYQWAEYAPAAGIPVDIGISPTLTWHDAMICHTVRGEHPLWQGPLQARTADSMVSFNSGLYNDGIAETLEASTQCSDGKCNEFATPRTHFGFVYTPINSLAPLQRTGRSLPVLLRAEVPASTLAAGTGRGALGTAIQSFVASINLQELTRP